MTSESPQVRAPALEMRGITKRYPGVVANQSIDLDIRPGRDPRPARRERRRQDDPDEHPLRAGTPGRGQDPHRRHRGRPDRAVRRDPPRDQHGPPALHAGPGADRRREHRPRRGDDRPRRLPRSQGGPQADRRARSPLRLRGRPGGQGRLAVGRLAAAGRDPEGALPRREGARPRRADRGPDAAGDARRSSRSCGAWRPRATASSSSATSCTRSSRSRTGSRSSGAARSSASASRPRRTRRTSPS